MAEWSNSAQELTIDFSVHPTLWNSLNRTQQQQLVKDETTIAAAPYGEVSKLKGYAVDTTVDPIHVHSVVWVIPNRTQQAVLDVT